MKSAGNKWGTLWPCDWSRNETSGLLIKASFHFDVEDLSDRSRPHLRDKLDDTWATDLLRHRQTATPPMQLWLDESLQGSCRRSRWFCNTRCWYVGVMFRSTNTVRMNKTFTTVVNNDRNGPHRYIAVKHFSSLSVLICSFIRPPNSLNCTYSH